MTEAILSDVNIAQKSIGTMAVRFEPYIVVGSDMISNQKNSLLYFYGSNF